MCLLTRHRASCNAAGVHHEVILNFPTFKQHTPDDRVGLPELFDYLENISRDSGMKTAV